MRIATSLLATVSLLALASYARAQASAPATQPAPDQAQLDRELEKTLSDATMVGRYSVDGNNQTPRQEHYTLGKVKKLSGDLWLIPARIQYSQRDVTLPIVVPIKWAGDTPVISITDMGLPGMGTYTARVVIYRDHYAGTWSAGPNHQGTLSGRIEHREATQETTKQKQEG